MLLPTKPQQAVAEQSQTKPATFISSMTNLKRDQKWQNTKNAKSSFLTPWQSSLSHNTQLLDATVWTPTFWCFPFCNCISIPVSVLLRDKKWGRKINLASFQLPYDTNWFVSPAAPCCWPDLFAHEQLLTSACWSLCCNLPDYLESSYSKLNLA